jgi:hypothetical protein
MFKIFSLHPTKSAALDALGAAIAAGEIGEADVFGCGIKALGSLWGIVVKPAFACRFDN